MNEDINTKLLQILSNGKTYGDRFVEVRAVVENLRREGIAKEDILAILEGLRDSVPEEQEDILLDVCDCLVGWCHPDARTE